MANAGLKKMSIGGAAALFALAAGAAPLKVAVFVGSGARNVGAFRWLELATMAEGVEAAPVDGASVRAGALEGMDMVVMPGGRASMEAAELGEDGRRRLVQFIKDGGSYIGTCAGFYLISERAGGKKANYLDLIPYRDTKSGGAGKGDVPVAFGARARELAGIPEGSYPLRYGMGPVPDRTGRKIEGTSVETVAFYDGELPKGVKRRGRFKGHAAAVAGTVGKGRVFVFTIHPEYDDNDHFLIRGAMRYLTGRDISWRLDRKDDSRPKIAFLADGSMGVETAKLLQTLMRKGSSRIVPLAKRELDAGERAGYAGVLRCGGKAVEPLPPRP